MAELAVGLALTLLVSLTIVAVAAFRNRIFVKLGLRNIPRRPAQTILIVIGLMLSSMIIAASLGVGDTITNSIRSFVVIDGLGHTDEAIRSPQLSFLGDDYLPQGDVDTVRAATASDSRIDGILPLIAEVLPVTNPRTGRTEARAAVRGYDVASLSGFGDLETTSGARTSLTALQPGEVYVNVDAERVLDARPGDQILVVTPTGRHTVTVRDIVKRGGIAGSDPRVVMSLAQLQQLLGREGEVNRIDISNSGGVMEGLALSDDVTDDLRLAFTDAEVADRLFATLKGDEVAGAIQARIDGADVPSGVADDLTEIAEALRGSQRTDRFTILMADETNALAVMAALEDAGMTGLAAQALPLTLGLPVLRVTNIKSNLVDLAEFVGTIFTTFFVIFGSFSIIVGLLLVFLVFVLLAAAREQEMGMARAIGTKRGHLVRLFTFEGTTYALVAGIVGTVLGILAAFLLVTILNSIFASDEEAFRVRADIEPRSMVVAFCAGVILTLITVAVSAYRVSKLTIVTAIRGLPEELARDTTPPLGVRAAELGWSLITPIAILRAEMMARGWGAARSRGRVLGYAAAMAIVSAAITSPLFPYIGNLALGFSLGFIWLWWVVKPLFARRRALVAEGGIVFGSAPANGNGYTEWGEPRTPGWLIAYFVFLPIVWIKRLAVALWRLLAPYNRLGLPALLAGLIVAILGISVAQASLWTIGASLFLVGTGQLIALAQARARGTGRDRLRIASTLAGVLVLIFWSLPFDSLEWLTGELDSSIEMFILSGTFMVGSAVWVVMNNADVLMWLFDRALGRFGSLKPVIRTAIAYPMAAKFRTGLTIAMFSLVIFTLIVFAILNNIGNVFREEPDRVTGGYDIRATISRDLPIDDIGAAIERSVELSRADFRVVSQTNTIRGEARQAGAEELAFKPIDMRGLDDAYLDTTVITFTHRDPAYGTTDREIWQALKNNPALAIMNGQAIVEPDGFSGPVADQFKVEGITNESPEDIEAIEVAVRAPGGRGNEVTRTVIAYMDGLANSLDVSGEEFDDGTQLATIFGQPSMLGEVAGRPVPPTIFQFRLADPSRAEEIAGRLETVFLDNSMQADAAQTLIDTNQEQGDAFNLLFQGFMGLGLLVGVAALGVISFRAVVERRQSIGMMRAIGYKGWMIQAGFLMEASIVALLGIAIGIGLGSVISYNIVQEIAKEIDGLKFNVPWINVIAIVAIAWVFAMITTYWPARQASRIYPSEALRYE